MRRRAFVPLAALVVAIDLVVAVVAVAQTTGGGFLGGGEIGGWVQTTGPGTGGSTGTASSAVGGSGSGPAPTCTGDTLSNSDLSPFDPGSHLVTGPISYTQGSPGLQDALNNPNNDRRTILRGKPDDAPNDSGVWWVQWCDGGTLGRGFSGYVWAPNGVDPATVGIPPAPPTQGEVQARTPLPRPTFGVSPTGTGLTGIETRLWDANGAVARSATTSIRGYTVASTATPQSWEWTMATPSQRGRFNPDPVLTADRPGTPADPAGRYRYETPNGYTLTLKVTWSGTYTYSGNGSGPQTQPLGTAVQTSTRDYRVVEVRSVIGVG